LDAVAKVELHQDPVAGSDRGLFDGIAIAPDAPWTQRATINKALLGARLQAGEGEQPTLRRIDAAAPEPITGVRRLIRNAPKLTP